jgi:TP901-1 family phage major tail protein
MSISGTGIFTDAASEETLRGYAFAGTGNNYQFIFGNGDYITGTFVVTSYERSGNYDAEETYAITLESAGTITFTGA